MDRLANRIASIGILVRPDQPIGAAIHMLPETGGKIILTEGEYIIRSQLRVQKPVAFVSLAPNRTTLRRTELQADAIVWADSPNVVFDGITFTDEARGGQCIRATGDNCVIKNCVFLSFKNAILSNLDDGSLQSSWSSATNNRFVGPGVATALRGADGNFIYEPAMNMERGNQWVIHGNHFGEWTSDSDISDETNVIEGSASFVYNAFTSNMAPTQQIKYKGGVGNEESTNIATVVVF
jgi:hypothetical protein